MAGLAAQDPPCARPGVEASRGFDEASRVASNSIKRHGREIAKLIDDL
jgi:hypothetical protein